MSVGKRGLRRFLRDNGALTMTDLVAIAERRLEITPPKKGEPRSSLNARCEDAYRVSQGKKPLVGTQSKPKKSKRKNFYKTAEWARLRYDALKANDGKCELCGASKADGATLHVDHIKPYAKHPALRAEPSNFQVLCATCNWGKGNRDDTDWREPRLRVILGEAME